MQLAHQALQVKLAHRVNLGSAVNQARLETRASAARPAHLAHRAHQAKPVHRVSAVSLDQ